MFMIYGKHSSGSLRQQQVSSTEKTPSVGRSTPLARTSQPYRAPTPITGPLPVRPLTSHSWPAMQVLSCRSGDGPCSMRLPTPGSRAGAEYCKGSMSSMRPELMNSLAVWQAEPAAVSECFCACRHSFDPARTCTPAQPVAS